MVAVWRIKGTDTDNLLTNVPVIVEPSDLDLIDKHLEIGSELPAKSETEKKNIIRNSEKSINKQIRDLIRKRAEVRKSRKELGNTTNEDTGSIENKHFPPLLQRTPRNRPRIISNVRIAPPRDPMNRIVTAGEMNPNREDSKDSSSQKEWKKVSGRRKSNSKKMPMDRDPMDLPEKLTREKNRRISGKPRNNQKPLKNAAILITSRKEEFTYADMLRNARVNISLDELQIKATKIRTAANGGMLIEVLGPDSQDRAKALATKLQDTLKDQAKVVRPTIKDEIRLTGMDDSVSPEEILYTVSLHGECDESDIRLGQIRQMNNGLFTVWAQCPLNAAIKVANQKKVKIGWTFARIDLLESRPVQCFKC